MAKRNSIFDAIVYAKANKVNTDILEDYVLEMKSNGKGEKTIYQYTADIKMFFCWVVEKADNQSILKLKKRDFRKFFLQLQDSGASSARINRVQCSLRNILEFCVQDDDEYEEYEINVMKSVKGLMKEEVREIFFITDEQINIILDELIFQKQFQRALYLAISYESAARRNEVFQILKDGFLENKMTNEVVGKRNKRFKLMYFGKSKEIAEMYFEQRGEDAFPELWTVGIPEERRPAKYETLYAWTMTFREILKNKTGVDIDLNPHSFRHSSLTNYNNGTHYVLKELGTEKLDLKVLKLWPTIRIYPQQNRICRIKMKKC